MNAPTLPVGQWPRTVAILLVLIGAFVAAASAASEDFDFGADLELGRAVHESLAGRIAGWTVAALLLIAAAVAVVDAGVAGRLLHWTGGAAAVASLVAIVVTALFARHRVDDALSAVPFVVVVFTVPAYVVGELLRESADGGSRGTTAP